MKEPIIAFRSKPLAERVCLAIVALVTVFYAGASAWEALGPLECGQFCAMSYLGIAGENMLKWRNFAVVINYTAVSPTQAQYYSHHPYGPAVVAAACQALFGHNSFSIHAPAIIYGVLIPPLLYGLSRAIWGPVAAAVTTVIFALVPINLAFAKFGLYELTTIFWGLLYAWGTIRLWQTWRARYLVAAIMGVIGLCQADWIGCGVAGAFATFAFVRAYVLPRRWVGNIQDREHAQWFAATVATTGGTILLYVVLFAKSGHLPDLLGSFESRSTGASTPLSEVFGQQRWMRIQWTLPVMTLWAVAIAVPLGLVRTFLVSAVEVVQPIWFLCAAVQYLIFKQGADVHIFWPHMFGTSVALACGCLVAQAAAFREWLVSRVGAPSRSKLNAGLMIAGVSALGLYAIVLGRMGLAQLRQSHLTCGQFDEGGEFIWSYRNASTFTDWAMHDIPQSFDLALHTSFAGAPNLEYTARRVVHTMPEMQPTTSNDLDRYELAFAGLISPGQMTAWAQNFAPEIAGPFWKIDRARPREPLNVYQYVEREPTLLESFFITGTDAVRSIGPIDPYGTWEWRRSLSITPNPPPSSAPSSFDELRIAHNVAFDRKDLTLARNLRDDLKTRLTEVKEAHFSDDIQLVGWRIEEGAVPIATLLWETGPGFVPFDGEFHVRSKIGRPPRLWASATDFHEKEVAPKDALRPPLWKAGFLYSQRFVVVHRIGEEKYRGFFTSNDATPAPRPAIADSLELFTLD
jgi:hypothetical protein